MIPSFNRAIWAASLLCLSTTLACSKDRQVCEKERLALAKNFAELKNSAGTLKYARIDEAATTTPSDAEREARLKHWSKLEERAALLESAFISRQVTWESAEVAKRDLNTWFKDQADQNIVVQGFGTMLERVNQMYESFKGRCK